MKALFLSTLACAALASSAADLTLSIDTKAPARRAFPHGAPCVGYAADPQPGGEEAAVACRRAGAWLFRTASCDDATLAFCAQYGLRLFIVLEGGQKEVAATLNRLAQSPHREVVAGLQLGADSSAATDPSTCRKLAALAARHFPDAPVALPVKDLDSPSFTALAGSVAPFTHLIVDLRGAAAPYATLERIAGKLRNSPDKATSGLRLWVVGPGRLPGTDDAAASAPAALAWQMHWIMSAFAVDLTDGVFAERPCRADDFGLAMRYLWIETNRNRSLIGHGEGATSGASGAPAAAPEAPAADFPLGDDLGADQISLSDAWTPGPAPHACENVAAGRAGDVEYLVLLAPPVPEDGQQVCMVIVNTSGERATIRIDVNKSGGNVTSGWRHRLIPDAETGSMRNSTRERFGKPFAETVEPGEITFLDFRI